MFGTDRHGWIFFPKLKQHQLAAGLQRVAYSVEHTLRPRKLVVDVGEQHQIQLANGKPWIRFVAQHGFDVRDVPGLGFGFELFEHFRLNIVRVNNAAWRHAICDAESVKSGSGAHIADKHSRPEVHGGKRFFRLLLPLPVLAVQPIGRADAHDGRDAPPCNGMNGLREDGDARKCCEAARCRRKPSHSRRDVVPHISLISISAILLFFCLGASNLCRAASSTLAVIDAGVAQADDAPFVPPSYEFLPGDYLYFTFQIGGYGIRSEQRGEVHKISLTYDVAPEDAHGVPLTQASSGTVATDLSPEDKNWQPKRRASFLIPSFVGAGEYRVRVHVKDLIAKSETSQDFAFRIGGVAIQPSASVTVENFHFFRSENDRQPLDIPAFSPGDTVFVRFDLAGFKTGPQNQYHLSYGLTVLRPDGKPFLEKPNAAELQSSSFYPAQFLPCDMDLRTAHDSERGEYIVVLTVRDLVANTSSESKKAFSIE